MNPTTVTTKSFCYINSIPNEVFDLMFQFLSPKYQRIIFCVCKNWKSIVSSSKFSHWRVFFGKLSGVSKSLFDFLVAQGMPLDRAPWAASYLTEKEFVRLPNEKRPWGPDTARLAAEKLNFPLVQYLVDLGYFWDITAVFPFLKAKNFEAVFWLVERCYGINSDFTRIDKETILAECAKTGDLELIQKASEKLKITPESAMLRRNLELIQRSGKKLEPTTESTVIRRGLLEGGHLQLFKESCERDKVNPFKFIELACSSGIFRDFMKECSPIFDFEDYFFETLTALLRAREFEEFNRLSSRDEIGILRMSYLNANLEHAIQDTEHPEAFDWFLSQGVEIEPKHWSTLIESGYTEVFLDHFCSHYGDPSDVIKDLLSSLLSAKKAPLVRKIAEGEIEHSTVPAFLFLEAFRDEMAGKTSCYKEDPIWLSLYNDRTDDAKWFIQNGLYYRNSPTYLSLFQRWDLLEMLGESCEGSEKLSLLALLVKTIPLERFCRYYKALTFDGLDMLLPNAAVEANRVDILEFLFEQENSCFGPDLPECAVKNGSLSAIDFLMRNCRRELESNFYIPAFENGIVQWGVVKLLLQKKVPLTTHVLETLARKYHSRNYVHHICNELLHQLDQVSILYLIDTVILHHRGK